MRKLSHANDKWVMVSLLGFFFLLIFFVLLHTHIVRQWILSVFLWSNNWLSTCQKKQMLNFHATTFYVLLCSAAFSLPDKFVPITLCS